MASGVSRWLWWLGVKMTAGGESPFFDVSSARRSARRSTPRTSGDASTCTASRSGPLVMIERATRAGRRLAHSVS
jgi:hypothetical protein